MNWIAMREHKAFFGLFDYNGLCLKNARLKR